MFPESVRSRRPANGPSECRWAETPPVIDGRGDDAGWQRARLSWKTFAKPGRRGSLRRVNARAYACCGIARRSIFSREMDDDDVTATVSEHDGRLWENDVFEIFLRPSEQHAGYYEFEVNPFGAVLDAFFPPQTARGIATA